MENLDQDLDKDYATLSEDFETVLALESMGARPHDVAMLTIAKRWVAQEYYGENGVALGKRITKDAAKAALKGGWKGTKKLSSHLANTFMEWAKARDGQIRQKLADATSKGETIRRRSQKMQSTVLGMKSWPKHEIKSGGWTAKVCQEDDINVDACIQLAQSHGSLDDIVEAYTVFTKSILKNPAKREGDSLAKLGHSTSKAVKRASGILGIVKTKAVNAYPLPGNVIVVVRNPGVDSEAIQFAVARDGEYGDTIPALDLATCKKALMAAEKLGEAIYARGTKRGVFSYNGIYDSIQSIEGELERDDLSNREVHRITQRYKNAIEVEDAITTALVRVAEGLMDYVQHSIKK
ncbi:hypothetical protein PHOBOS_96 [Erwinia phage vB_EamM_Phobos]|uniref:internal head protein n=1 Tax=Erwinia phage vB_EamM_Phobos TaxID=1883377 RepID=UPI00081C6A15|nr:internal head protein [Erwinia phage vB_EamM_Phobos]ANZ50286.1 hypothetical protein PHOBOS_96 [Erwinia phage vB_EamM_Phobos]